MKIIKVLVALLPWLFSASAALDAPDLTPLRYSFEISTNEVALALEGKALLPIVVENSPRAVWAARYLASVLKEITGAEFEVYRELGTNIWTRTPALFVGKCGTLPLPEVPAEPQAFAVHTAGNSVQFAGECDYAVFDWCERILDVRYFWPRTPAEHPGNNDDRLLFGFVSPRQATLSVVAVSYADAPVFDCRTGMGLDKMPCYRSAKAGGDKPRFSVHAPHRWYLDRDLARECPGIFSTQAESGPFPIAPPLVPSDEVPAPPPTPMLCYSGEDTLEVYLKAIDLAIAEGGNAGGIVDVKNKTVTVSQWDAPYACRCQDCRLLRDERLGFCAEGSPVIWGKFLPALAKRLKVAHPDYRIVFLPYWNSCRAPMGLELPENTEAVVCVMPGLAMLKNHACRAREEATLADWRRITGHKVVSWQYTCWPEDFTTAPYVFGRTVSRHYRDMSEVVRGSIICGSFNPRSALSLYVLFRVLWNPKVEVERIYDEFCRRMFGPSAVPMRKLVALQEAAWERQWPSKYASEDNVWAVSYPPMVVEEIRALLSEAQQLAGEDVTVRTRLAFYKAQFE